MPQKKEGTVFLVYALDKMSHKFLAQEQGIFDKYKPRTIRNQLTLWTYTRVILKKMYDVEHKKCRKVDKITYIVHFQESKML